MKLTIQGGNALRGRLVGGAKNAALVLIAASAIVRGEVVLDNVPRIADVETQLEIVRALGCRTVWQDSNRVSLSWPEQPEMAVPYRLAKKLRASNLFLGALVARTGQARIPLPGGCDIGSRPMDLHTKGLQLMGFAVTLRHGFIEARACDPRGNQIYLDFPSVGATENIMMAAVGVNGTTVVENAAKEPEIVDLASFLNGAGATIRGAGTDLVKIEGKRELRGTRFSVIPDRIEAGTYMIAAAAAGKGVMIENVIIRHLQPVIAKLQDMGLEVAVDEDSLEVRPSGPLMATDIKTFPYPGFPTDLQSPAMSLLCLAGGTSVIVENVFENRFRVADELKRMGAEIRVKGHSAVVEGPVRLYGAQVRATDLRAGAALMVAALAAEGETEISQAELISRGYEKVVEKFADLGARLQYVE